MIPVKSAKTLSLLLATLFSVSLFGNNSITQDSTGLPGDNFSLEAVLNLFKNSESPEDFEKKLNSEDSEVNNLDLNEDGKIDYIRVTDNMDGDVHAIVLQVPVSEAEVQDIAVIEIEKDGPESAMLQIIGDENIYGETLIVEPFEEQASGGKKGPNADLDFDRIVVSVWWPSVRFVYRPHYRVWRSPYRWGYYPTWWTPWKPRSYRWYHPRHTHHRSFFRVSTTHRVVRAHRVYTPHRRSSKVVVTKTTRIKTTRVASKRGPTTTKKTTSKTVVKKTPNGKVAGKKKTTTTKVKGKNGKVKGKKTTTTVKGKKRNGRTAGKKKKKRGGN